MKQTNPWRYVAILIGMYCMTSVAAPIGKDAAKRNATVFVQSQAKGVRPAQAGQMNEDLQLVFTHKLAATQGYPLYYVFNRPNNGGYVIAAGDDCINGVLGYSDKGSFDADDMPENMQWWLGEYERQMTYAIENGVSIRNAAKAIANVKPLLTSTWDQISPYNDMCPKYKGETCLTGCVATAMAQIMYYFKWPDIGYGQHEYTFNVNDDPRCPMTLSADFGNTTFRWNDMKDSYTYTGFEFDFEAAAMAELMLYCGIAVNMGYGTSGSGGAMRADAFLNYFRYYGVKEKYDVNDADIIEIVGKELTGSRPVLMDGRRNENDAGHAFVCDGYKDGYFHFNWGWGGRYDGYFLLSDMTPNHYNFSYNHSIIYNFHPYKGEIPAASAEIEVNTPGTLQDIDNAELYYSNSITIKGKINQTDINALRDMMSGSSRLFPVENLDLSEAVIYNDDGTPSNVLPDNAFIGCRRLTSIVIPNSVTSIGNYAFGGCSGLTSVTIPNSVTSIGNNAFSGCSGLTFITIPNSVTSIGDYAFYGCSGLTSVTIGNSVTSIGISTFHSCSGLTSVTIGNSVTSIGYGAFDGCNSLTSVTFHCKEIGWWFSGNEIIHEVIIGEEVTSIGEFAFQDCISLTSITIPNSVTSIGRQAFCGCGLTSITIPNSVTSIGISTFHSCSGLTSVTIPNSVTSIGNQAFEGCSGLTSVTIGNSVTSIGEKTFSGCSGLTSVTIPNSVTSIGNQAFEGCSGLTSVTFHCKEIGNWFSGNEIIHEVIIGDEVTSIGQYSFFSCSGLTSVTIGNSVTSIGDWAFLSCSGLTSVTIGNSVTSIGDGAFCGCSSLTSVTIPNSVTSIGGDAFKACSGLTSVTIPNSVTSIGELAFCMCFGLISVTIPNSVMSIGDRAFAYCSGLTKVHSMIEEPFAITENVFEHNDNSSKFTTATLYVPIGCKEKYETTFGWKKFTNIVEMDKESMSVNALMADKAIREKKYSLDGKLIRSPKKGIYISNGKKYMEK